VSNKSIDIVITHYDIVQAGTPIDRSEASDFRHHPFVGASFRPCQIAANAFPDEFSGCVLGYEASGRCVPDSIKNPAAHPACLVAGWVGNNELHFQRIYIDRLNFPGRVNAKADTVQNISREML